VLQLIAFCEVQVRLTVLPEEKLLMEFCPLAWRSTVTADPVGCWKLAVTPEKSTQPATLDPHPCPLDVANPWLPLNCQP
jgi:hypothetical protein